MNRKGNYEPSILVWLTFVYLPRMKTRLDQAVQVTTIHDVHPSLVRNGTNPSAVMDVVRWSLPVRTNRLYPLAFIRTKSTQPRRVTMNRWMNKWTTCDNWTSMLRKQNREHSWRRRFYRERTNDPSHPLRPILINFVPPIRINRRVSMGQDHGFLIQQHWKRRVCLS